MLLFTLLLLVGLSTAKKAVEPQPDVERTAEVHWNFDDWKLRSAGGEPQAVKQSAEWELPTYSDRELAKRSAESELAAFRIEEPQLSDRFVNTAIHLAKRSTEFLPGQLDAGSKLAESRIGEPQPKRMKRQIKKLLAGGAGLAAGYYLTNKYNQYKNQDRPQYNPYNQYKNQNNNLYKPQYSPYQYQGYNRYNQDQAYSPYKQVNKRSAEWEQPTSADRTFPVELAKQSEVSFDGETYNRFANAAINLAKRSTEFLPEELDAGSKLAESRISEPQPDLKRMKRDTNKLLGGLGLAAGYYLANKYSQNRPQYNQDQGYYPYNQYQGYSPYSQGQGYNPYNQYYPGYNRYNQDQVYNKQKPKESTQSQ